MKTSLLAMKSILKLFDFKVEVRDDKTVPKQLYDLGINDPDLALPTKSLLAHSSSMYPGRSIRCVYYGDTWFWVISDYEDAMGIFLTQEVARLYTATIIEYLKTRDISTIEKKIQRILWNIQTRGDSSSKVGRNKGVRRRKENAHR